MDREGAFTLLRELPSRPTQRVGKLSAELDALARQQDQICFPGSATDQQLALGTFQQSWQELLLTLRDLQHGTMAGVLDQLQQWSARSAGQAMQQQQQQHAPSSSQQQLQPDSSSCDGLLPTVALSLASSTNTAEAYAHLLCTMKQQGHPTALITAHESGTGLAAVINSAMRQFLGAHSAADDMPALLAWWHDERQRSSSTGQHSRQGPAAGAASTPAKPRPAQADPSTGAPDERDVDGTPAATPAKRQLRARAGAQTPAGKTPGARGGQPGSGAAALQAPVLVLQDADSVDADALEELVVALHEARRAGLPLVLVLGITSSHHGLLQLLPNSILRRIQLLQLSLPPAWQQLTRFYGAVLLAGPQPHVVLGPGCASWLLEHFRDVDTSASMAQRAMQLACVEHHLKQPLSCLATAAACGSRRKLQTAIRALPQGQLLRCFSALASSAQLSCLAQAAAGDAGVMTDLAAAQQTALGYLQAAAAGSRGARRGAEADVAAGSAAAVLEGAVWGAMTSFQQWRTGLLMLNLVAKFTGVAEVDASFQLPALYATAQQRSFLTITKRGLLSTCSRLLLKLLGSSSGINGSGWPARGKVVPVDRMSSAECAELLQKLLQLLSTAQHGESGTARDSKASTDAAGADSSSSSSDIGGSSSSSDDGSSSESDGDSEASGRSGSRRRAKKRAQQTPLASSSQIEQLVQALGTLHATAAAAAGGADAAQGAAKRGSNQQDTVDEGLLSALQEIRSAFVSMLNPLPELVEPTAAAAAATAAAEGMEGIEDADAAALGICSTPAGTKSSKGGPDSVRTPLPTPGGLASALRKRVRFAPDTPDHAKSKAAGPSSSAKSTPDDEAAPGLIKTPNKRGSTGKKPRKLFDSQAAAAAAAAAAGDKPGRRSKREKQESAVGDIAGSSAAALAAVTAAAAGGAPAGPVGNKRHARLAGMYANTAGSSQIAAAAAALKAGSSRASPAPARKPAQQPQQQQAAGLLLSPTACSPVAAAAAASPDSAAASAAAGGSSRLRNSSSAANSPAAAAAAGGGDAGLLSPGRGRGGAAGSRARSGSRLSRRSEAVPASAAAADTAEDDVDMDAEPDEQLQTDQQQQQEEEFEQQLAPAVAAAAAALAAPPASCGVLLAQLLAAVIPKLLLDWSCPSSKASTLFQDLSSSILQDSSSTDSSAAERAAAVAAGASLAVAGAAAFTFDDVAVLERHLAPAAPAAVHTALVVPALHLQGHPYSVGNHGWEDTCLAYVLLQQQRDDGMPVSDWFGLFCESLGLKGFQSADEQSVGAAVAAAAARGMGTVDDRVTGNLGGAAGGVVGAAAGRAMRSKARTGRKARGYADARASEEDPAAAAAGGSGSGVTPSRRSRQQQPDQDKAGSAAAAAGKGGRKRSSSAAAREMDVNADREEVDQQELLAAAARFSQAAAELQLLGVWKGTKRRRAAGVLRVFAPEGPALPSMAAAAAAAADEDVDVM